jgi:hypothetical protein
LVGSFDEGVIEVEAWGSVAEETALFGVGLGEGFGVGVGLQPRHAASDAETMKELTRKLFIRQRSSFS